MKLKNHGVLQGLPAPIVGAMAENATLFWTYTEIQNAIKWANGIPSTSQLSLGLLALAGAGAGSITSFVLYVPRPFALGEFCAHSHPDVAAIRALQDANRAREM